MTDCIEPTLQVDGKSVSVKLLRIPPMDLSSSRASMQPCKILLKIPAQQICDAAKAEWEAYAIRCMREEARLDRPDEDDWVAMAGYPPLEEVIQDQEELDFLFGRGGRLRTVAISKTCDFDNQEVCVEDKKHYIYLDNIRVEKIDNFIVWSGIGYRSLR
ncbi:hypothetical protein [Kordiimonas sp. SCSIO 12610]|uniref:hypothetical protein n=1 Tax=Kordiimonas sp. SCSIO 12610 TaxID=2829597 RepID=UPI002109E839|nr:hypothetical protein [Kordiimonas sp. SCSIO 12610]UTW54379.1 hypothetical protein KFF44_11195 [Kordiimonas sp. SCSIO 12610]